jgi:hypothetical protein
MGYFFHFSSFLDENISDLRFLLEIQVILPETSPFFVCPNGFGEHLFSNVYSTWDV